MKEEMLNPTRKNSFYGNAVVISFDDGWKFLRSYDTIVAGIDPYGGKRRFSSCRSATTGRHIVAFFEKLGILMKAKDFFKWPVEELIQHSEIQGEI